MTNILHSRLLAWSAVLIVAALIGCASTGPTKFYTLSSAETRQGHEAPGSLSIEVGPVEIPDYLDRPHLVTRTSRNELMISDFHKWAGSLEDDILRVLVEDLSSRLSTDSVFMYSWPQSSPVNYNVRIKVNRFEGTEDAEVILKAYWSIYGEGGSTLLIQKSSHIHQPPEGNTYTAIVSAMSRAIGKLSDEIADAITSLSHP